MEGDSGGEGMKRIDRVSEWSLARVFVEGLEVKCPRCGEEKDVGVFSDFVSVGELSSGRLMLCNRCDGLIRVLVKMDILVEEVGVNG
jgi:uncharacterized protein (DUF983 family)